MSTKISDLTSATSLTGAEEVPIVQTGTTKKTDISAIAEKTNEVQDVTSSITYTVSTGVTITDLKVYKVGGFYALYLGASYARVTASVKTLLTLSNLFPITASTGTGTTYADNDGAKLAIGRIKTNGEVDIIGLNGSHQQCGFGIIFIPAS